MTTDRTLILMRHAAAGGAARDHDRPLTQDGVRTATEAGRWIRTHLAPVDFVICSSAVRTRQTLAATGVAAQTRFADELYGGGVDEVLEQVAGMADTVRTLLVIGHAPTIPSVARELLVRARSDDATQADPAAEPATDEPAPTPDDEQLRRFSAGSFAVLTSPARWSDLPGAGAELKSVQHPAF